MQDGNHEVEYKDHPLMEVNGKYLLFLKKIESGEYVMIGGLGAKFDYNSSENKFYSKWHEISHDDLLSFIQK